jgi:hypothetical protein
MRPPSVEFLVIVVCQGAEMDDARQWAEEQWSACDLGDRRRTRRAVALGVRMAEHSDRSLPRQMAGMADLKAAYRLLDSEGATLEALTAPHRDRVRRAAGWSGDPVLFVQDQTCLDFSGHPATEGLGPIGNAGLENDFTRGFIAQTCLAVVAPPVGRRIIGLAALTVRTRDGIRKGTETKAQRQKRDNESGLWFGTLQGIGRPPEGALWISVGGSDIFHYFRQAADAGWHVLSRLCQDRLIEDLEAPGGPESLLFRLRNLEAMAQQAVERPPAGSRPCRLELSVSWLAVRLLAPRLGPWRTAPALECWLVRVWNADLEWLLLSTVPVTDAESAARTARWYSFRWLVEEYHKGLKTGCRYERAQLRTAHRLLALLGFLALVAVRLLQVRDEARQRPLTPAVEIVPVLLVQLVALHFNLEAAGMTIHTFWRCVAKVGGFPGRKGDGDPGWLTLWQGWSEVLQWYRGALLMKAMARCG